jgi:uncharacterized protein with HEPN domain
MKTFEPQIAVIRDSIVHIQRYQPSDLATFLAQPMAKDAILMRLQVIGEALATMRNADEELFSAIGDESWNEIIGLRNIISHGYVVIKIERIWDFLIEDLPALVTSIEKAAEVLP